MPQDISSWIEQNLRINADIQQNLLVSVVVILAILLLRQAIYFFVRRRTDDAAVIYRWRKATEYLTFILGFFALAMIWLPDASSFATYLGLLSAGLAIALQDPIADFVGWIFIVSRHPFSMGDRIQIGEHAGDVVDIRYFQFSLMEIGAWVDADQSTGRVIHIPNKKVFSEPLANYSKGISYIWNELTVQVTFESDWAKAKETLQAIAESQVAHLGDAARKRVAEANRRYMISYDKLTPIVYTRVVDSGVRLTVRYLTEPRKRRGSENAMWEAILSAFAAEPTIEFAYPTIRYYSHAQESTPPLRPEAMFGADREMADGPDG